MANAAPCDHLTADCLAALRLDPATGNVQCGRCGHVWLDRAEVQARNHKVARSVMQLLGTLLGGTKPITEKAEGR